MPPSIKAFKVPYVLPQSTVSVVLQFYGTVFCKKSKPEQEILKKSNRCSLR